MSFDGMTGCDGYRGIHAGVTKSGVKRASRHFPEISKESFSRKGKYWTFKEVVNCPTLGKLLVCHFPEII